jgi:hypothetical protein
MAFRLVSLLDEGIALRSMPIIVVFIVTVVVTPQTSRIPIRIESTDADEN